FPPLNYFNGDCPVNSGESLLAERRLYKCDLAKQALFKCS
ncbi:MAG: hypothetical protein ACI9WC_000640, partial [Arenicella sp.]